MSKPSLNTLIFSAAFAGIGLGLAFRALPGSSFAAWGINLCELTGGLFIDLLKMILIPLAFASIATGVANLRAHESMHRVWRLTLAYFFSTTALAILLGLSLANIFKPGAGLDQNLFGEAMRNFDARRLSLGEFFGQFFHGLFQNPVAAMAKGDILAVVTFALIVGVALAVRGDRNRHVLELLNEALELVMHIVDWIMRLAPLGVLALLAKLTATQDMTLFASLGKFAAVVVGGTLFHGFVVLPSLLFLATGIGPSFFFRGAREALTTAFATCSSSATLPITLRCVEEELDVDPAVAGFVPPLGATLNMDGTALYEAAAALFVANLAGIELNLLQQAVVCFTAMLASIGAPGIPSAGMATLAMVLQAANLPVEAIAILLPMDRPLDSIRTMVNVEGDMVGSLIVNRFSQARSPNDG
jgi:Na+/H+-dicarboxylate symporter